MARAAVLERTGESFIILSLELCNLERELEKAIRSCVAERSGFPESAICISTTHTHSGPQAGGLIGWGHTDDLYVETLPQRALAAVEAALANREPVGCSTAEVACQGIAINRDYDVGYDQSLPVDTLIADDWRPPRPELTDPRCRMLAFHHDGELRGLLHSFACHPVVCCEKCTRVHGDFPGLANIRIEKEYPGALSIFLPGALGDVNTSVAHRSEPESLRALEAISNRYADCLDRGLQSLEAVENPVLYSITHTVAFPRVDWGISDVEDRIMKLERQLQQSGQDDNPLAGGSNPLERSGIYVVQLKGLRRIREQMRHGESLQWPARLQGIRIGPVCLLGSPFEVYQSTARSIREAFGENPVWILSLVNGAEGYAPDPKAYQKNRYATEFVNLMMGHLPHTCLHDPLIQELSALGRQLLMEGRAHK